MSLKTARGKISLTNGFEDPSSSNLPNIISFTVGDMDSQTNRFYVYFSVERNYATLQLICRFLDDNDQEVSVLKNVIDVFNLESYMFYKNKNYKISLELVAVNKNGQDSRKLEPIDKANNNLSIFDSEIISDFKIANTKNTYDQVDFSFNLNKIVGFNILDVEELTLYYQRKDYLDWKPLQLQNIYTTKQNEARVDISYFYNFEKIKIERPSDGGYFNFKIAVKVKNFEGQESEILSLYFDNLAASETKQDDSKFPKAELIDSENPASLKYEISTRIAQGYYLYSGQVYNDPLVVPFYSYFLNNTDSYKASSEISSLIFFKNGESFFPYAYQYKFNPSQTKGFIFPASVSEILPCILINKLSNQNQSIVLFWKINDNFFDYDIFDGIISIFTSYIKVKVQYKINNIYEDLTSEITLTKDQNYKISEQKFILFLRRDIDILQNKRSYFDSIEDNDNKTDNLRILVTEHKVDCFHYQYSTKTLTFDKLLIPGDWKYIAYDKYIPKDADLRISETKKIKLDIDSLYLRGIRLPEKAFKKFDTLTGLFSDGDSGVGDFNVKIMYRLSCDFDVFYQDPILEGTVNSVELPSIPNDVFITPPDLVLPPPNYLSIANGGIQAEGLVTLNEYGKINGIQITNPGQGYSLYKNALSKRQQSFTDLIPYVKTSYLVVGTNQNSNPSSLVVKNASFDSAALLGSIRGGVRLASANNDKALLNNSTDSLSSLQDKKIDEYFQRQIPDNSYIEGNSVEDYQVVTPEVEQKSIGVLDEDWSIISQLYSNKNINPYEQSIIYSEDTDAGVSSIGDSSINSNPVVSNEITPITIDPESDQTSSSGGEWKMFELSNLKIIPDSSPAVSVVNTNSAPPWMTLLPTSLRSDNMYGFGPLPNMLPRAEMFNRFAIATNNLNSVRLLAPFVWRQQTTRDMKNYYKKITTENEYDVVNFSTNGIKVVESYIPSDPIMSPINSVLSVSASRSVGKSRKTQNQAYDAGLKVAGDYIVSSEISEKISFEAMVHPSMVRAIPLQFLRSGQINRKYLGIVTEVTETCGSQRLPTNELNFPFVTCSDSGGNNFDRQIPSVREIPQTKTTTEVSFKFFNGGGNSLSLSAGGSAKAFQFFIGNRVCGDSCGDASSQTVDFGYTNLFPAIISL